MSKHQLQDMSGTPPGAPREYAGRGVGVAAADEQMNRVQVTSAVAQRAPASRPQPPATAPGMIIRTGDVSVEVDSVEASIAAIRRLAASVGGYIGNVSTNTGEHQVRSAVLEMKVPASRFDEAMGGMSPLGKVERSSVAAQDVGEEFVDITARVANAKRLETRLIALLATRTGKLEDVLAVERELARVRGEIEQYEGRIRYLSSRVATSTIMVTVHEKPPLVATQPGRNVFRLAFINMWRNFVSFAVAAIELLGIAIPVALLAALAFFGWKRWRRQQRSAVVQDPISVTG